MPEKSGRKDSDGEVLVCKGYLWECDGEPPDIGDCDVWRVADARLRPDGFAADCVGQDDDEGMQHVELKRISATEFTGRWTWNGTDGSATAVLYDVGGHVFGSGTWHAPSRRASGRWMFDLEVVRRIAAGSD